MTRLRRRVALVAAVLAPVGAAIVASPGPATAAGASWVHQLGSGSVDYGTGVATDRAGSSYVTGYTNGRVLGAAEEKNGGFDVFLAKYSKSGARVWVHQFGSSTNDYGRGVAVDHTGNAYVTGSTAGRFGSAEVNAGQDDIFVAKFSPAGKRIWVHQMGTADSDAGYAIAVDGAGNAYVTGETTGRLPGQSESSAGRFDVFVAKYSTSGARAWVHRLGSSGNEYGRSVAVDRGGNAYIVGDTDGQLSNDSGPNAGRSDVFVAKYTTNGARLWVRQLGTTRNEFGYGVAADAAGNAFITGVTDGRLAGSPEANAGDGDAFVVKYSKSGSQRWVHQLGRRGSDRANAVGVDGSGNVYLTGATDHRLPGVSEANAGGTDVFVAKYSGEGARIWVHPLGGHSDDDAFAIAVDVDGSTSVTGITGRILAAPESNAGGIDAFVARDI